MWYAVMSKPLVAALTAALLGNAATAGAGFFAAIQTEPAAPAATVVLHPVIPLPVKPKRTDHDFPSSFYQPVSLPSRYRLSERGALEYLARALHIQVQFTGPDYAMIGQHLPYNRPRPAIKLLLQIASIPYIQGTFALMGDKLIIVHNAPLAG